MACLNGKLDKSVTLHAPHAYLRQLVKGDGGVDEDGNGVSGWVVAQYLKEFKSVNFRYK